MSSTKTTRNTSPRTSRNRQFILAAPDLSVEGLFSNILGNCAASRAHTCRNLGRNSSDMTGIDTATAPPCSVNTPSKKASKLPPLPLTGLPLCPPLSNRFRLPLPPLSQKFPRIEARGTGGDRTARGVARTPAKKAEPGNQSE